MNDEIKFSSFIITATIHKKFLVYSFRSHFLKKFILLSSKFEIKQHNDGGDLTYRMFIRYMQKILLTSSPGDPVSPASPTGPLDPCGKKNNNNPLNWTVGSSEIYRMYMICSHQQFSLRFLFPVTCWPATPGAPTVPLSPRAPCSNKRRTTM